MNDDMSKSSSKGQEYLDSFKYVTVIWIQTKRFSVLINTRWMVWDLT